MFIPWAFSDVRNYFLGNLFGLMIGAASFDLPYAQYLPLSPNLIADDVRSAPFELVSTNYFPLVITIPGCEDHLLSREWHMRLADFGRDPQFDNAFIFKMGRGYSFNCCTQAGGEPLGTSFIAIWRWIINDSYKFMGIGIQICHIHGSPVFLARR
jgi:hypothetical protein